MKRFRLVAFLIVIILVFDSTYETKLAKAETEPVRIWDYKNDENKLNTSIVVGNSTDTIFGYKLKDIKEKSHTWSVDDNTICRVNDRGNRISLTGLKEGITKLRLKVLATNGKTYDDFTNVSVYTPLSTAKGTAKKSTMVTRSANSLTDNKNERGYIPEGTELNVCGQCGNYYRVIINYNLDDGLDSNLGYVFKSDVNIPVTGITLNETTKNLKKGERARLVANIMPSIANDKTITWKSSNPQIVSVDENGVLTGQKDGEATIETLSGGKKASCKVYVSGEYKFEALKLSTQNKTIVIGEKINLYAIGGVADKYSTDNINIAKVGQDGTVEGIAPGNTIIKVTSLYNEVVLCKVTVKYPDAPVVKLKAVKNRKGKYKLSWSKVPKVKGYQIYYYKSKKKGYKLYKNRKQSKKRNVIVKKGKYKVRSYTVNKQGKKFYSAFTIAKKNKKTKAKYRIVYVGNGAQGKAYKQTVNFNKQTRIKTCKFKRNGYAFVGWATSKKGKVILKNKSRAKKLTNKDKIKLYAIWRSDNDPKGKVQRRALLYADTEDKRIGESTKRDIAQMERVFSSAKFTGEKPIEIAKYPDSNAEQAKNKIISAGRNTTKNDVTYMFFSCHGDADGILYLSAEKGVYIAPKTLREWLDDYTDGKVVLFLDFCYSGIHMKKFIAGTQKNFIKEFVSAGAGEDALKKNNKYKILTSAGDGQGLALSLGSGTTYWSLGMGFKDDGTRCTMFADQQGTDYYGNKCYGNGDGKITLSELYKYSNDPIHKIYVDYRKWQDEHSDIVSPYDIITVSRPQVYPQDDSFVIYQAEGGR